MASEFKIKNGLIVVGDVSTSGTITINGALAATQSWVASQAYLTSSSLTSYATQSYVTSAIASLVDSAPGALDTLRELATALGNDASFSTTITNSIASKQAQLNGTGLVRMSGTSVSYDNTTYTSVPTWTSQTQSAATSGTVAGGTWYRIANLGTERFFARVRVYDDSSGGPHASAEFEVGGAFNHTSGYSFTMIANGYYSGPSITQVRILSATTYDPQYLEVYISYVGYASSTFVVSLLEARNATVVNWTTGTIPAGYSNTTWQANSSFATGGRAAIFNNGLYAYESITSSGATFVGTKLSVGTSYNGFAANIAGTVYVIGASVWVNDGSGYGNANSPGTAFLPYSDGTLVFNSVNSEKMRIASSGNVGIGTTSPSSLLTVAGTTDLAFSNSSNLLRIDRSSGVARLQNYSGGAAANLNINWEGGNVGIGTSSPNYKLHVNGTAYINETLYVNQATTIEDTFTVKTQNGSYNVAVIDYSGTAGGRIKVYTDGILRSQIGSYYGDDTFFNVGYGGNVGIGTSSPGYKLEVNGSGGGSPVNIARFTSGGAGGGTRGLTMYTDGSQLKLQVSDNVGGIGTWAFLNLNPDGGYVGIGTTAPTTSLEVQGAADTSIQAIFQSASGANAAYNGGIQLGNAASNQKSSIVHSSAGDNTLTFTSHYSGGSANKFIFAPGGTERVRFQQNGNVGIGTTSPANKLVVTSDASPTNENTYAIAAASASDPAYKTIIGYDYSNDIGLIAAVRTGIGWRNLSIPQGSLGIGTYSPSAKLHVVGEIYNSYRVQINDGTANLIIGHWDGVNARIENSGGRPLLITSYSQPINMSISGSGPAFSLKADSNAYFTGSLGIGTSTPSSALEVIGTIRNKNASVNSNYSQLSTTEATLTLSTYSINTASYPANIIFSPASTEAMRINTAGKVSIGTTDTNSDKSDFTVYTGSGASLALVDDQVRMGSTDVNWGVALRSTGTLQTYGQALNLNTQAGNYAVNVQPNGTTVAQFYQDYSYFPGLDFSISRVNGVHASNYFRGDGSHLVIGTGGTLYLNYANTSGITYIFGTTYINNEQVATRAWVGSQNYLTSVSDIWVNTTGDTMTGALTIQGGWASTILDGDNVVLRKPNYSSGGWARTLLNFQEYDTTSLFQIGGYGNNNTLTYGYLGSAYNTPTIKWYANKDVAFSGKIIIDDVLDNNRYQKGGSFLNLRDPYNNIHLYNNGSGVYVDSPIHYWRSTAADYWMTLNSTGLGIGTSPSYKLDVNGTIRTQTGYILGANGSADIIIDGNTGSQLRYGNQKFTLNSADAYIYTNNIARVYVNNAGNVGIGTTTPGDYKLYVNGGQFGTLLKGGDLGTGSDVVRMIKSDGSCAMIVRGDGNIGIGTFSPTAPLEITATGGSGGGLTMFTSSYYSNLKYWGMRLYGTDNGNGIHYSTDVQVGADWYSAIRVGHGQNATNPSFQSYYTTYLATNGGNVGIGTTSPTTKLEVYGADNTSPIKVSFPSGNTLNTYTGIVFSGETPKAGILFVSNAAGYARGSLIFATSSSNDYTGINLTHEKMRITDVGNVGIGTSTPQVKLDVNGALGIVGSNYLYFGHTTGNIGAWTTRQYSSGSTHKFNAQTFIFNNEGYGSYEHMAITANGINLRAKNTIDSTDSWLRLNQSGDYGSGVYTPYVLRNDGEFINYGGIYGYNAIKGRKSQSVNNYTTAALWTESYDNTTTGVAFHISGNVGKFLEMRTNGVLYWDNAQVWTAGTLTNLNQLTNGPGYITSSGSISGSAGYTQTLALTGLGSATTNVNNGGSAVYRNENGLGGNLNYAPVLHLGGGDTMWQIQGDYYNSTDLRWRAGYAGTWYAWRQIYHSGNFTDNSSNWNTAYSWGNHASASYATTSYVTTQINNLVNGAPGALDTLNELATALGNDASFSTTVTNSIAGKVSKSGDTITGNLNVVGNIYSTTSLGIILNSADAPLITRGWDSFTSGPYNGIGRWGLFMESSTLVLGTPNIAGNGQVAFRRFNADGTSVTTLMVNNVGTTIYGNLTVSGTITENSSIKLKENVKTSEGNLEKVVNLRPVTYNKIGSQTTELGLIAEEVAEVYPEFVQYDESGEPVGVNYSRLTAALIGAVKELTNQVQELNKKING